MPNPAVPPDAVPPDVVRPDVVVTPLPYHYAVADLLERENPSSFASLLPAGPASPAVSGDVEQLDQALLRKAYRLEAAGHPEVHAAARRAAAALGIDVPIEIYASEGGGAPNAELIFVPGRVVLLLSGDVTELLEADELCAVAGHELAHYLLWTTEGGRLLAASRLLDAAEGDARTPSEYLETARRFRLATEVFADRGSLVAAGPQQTGRQVTGRQETGPQETGPSGANPLSAAIGGLLKISTGLKKVDAAAYLKQAEEVDFGRASAGVTHPETVLRAWAMRRWLDYGAGAEDAIAAALAPPLDLGSLDILGQDLLAAMTRQMVAELIDS
ncbi:MAG: peptidase Ste24p, partial [Pseudonocardiales bacterium]|nr:peptidase Ste24p [Pseudonocardiales bacterium]